MSKYESKTSIFDKGMREIQPIIYKDIQPVITKEIQPIIHKKIQPVIFKENQTNIDEQIKYLEQSNISKKKYY